MTTPSAQTVTAPQVERHPGPYSGPDVELARACAFAVIPWYGNDDGATHQRIMKNGVWNDHIAVQAALAAIHNMHKQAAAADARGKRLEEALQPFLEYLKQVRERFPESTSDTIIVGGPYNLTYAHFEAVSAALSQTEEGKR